MLRVHSAGNAHIFLRPWSPNVDGITEGSVSMMDNVSWVKNQNSHELPKAVNLALTV